MGKVKETLMSESTQDAGPESNKVYTKKDIQEMLDSIAKRSLEPHSVQLHAMLALNTILRVPNAMELFDEKLKTQARDLWTKLKGTGMQLNDPPLLFGMPAKADGHAKK